MLQIGWAVDPLPNISNWYCTDTHKQQQQSLAGLHWRFVVSPTSEASEGRSSDLRREHLLNQLGGRGRWQKSLPIREEVALLSFEVEGETGLELRRMGSVTVIPPLSALLGLYPLSPCGPTYQLVWRSRVCFLPVSLWCYWARQVLSEEPAVVCWKASDWQLGLTKLSQASITDSHCPSEREITETVTAACLCAACLSDQTTPSPCLMSNVTFVVHSSKQIPWKCLFKQIQTARLRLWLACQKWQNALANMRLKDLFLWTELKQWLMLCDSQRYI